MWGCFSNIKHEELCLWRVSTPLDETVKCMYVALYPTTLLFCNARQLFFSASTEHLVLVSVKCGCCGRCFNVKLQLILDIFYFYYASIGTVVPCFQRVGSMISVQKQLCVKECSVISGALQDGAGS